MHGLPEARPVLAAPAAGTLARAAGFAAGDTVRTIEGDPIATWQDLRWRVMQGALQREALRFEVEEAAATSGCTCSTCATFPPRTSRAMRWRRWDCGCTGRRWRR